MQLFETIQNQSTLSGLPLSLFQDLVMSLEHASMSVQLLLQVLQLMIVNTAS